MWNTIECTRQLCFMHQFYTEMWCSKPKWGTLQVKPIFSFYLMYQSFLFFSFKMSPHLSKFQNWSQCSNFTIEKGSSCFLYYFLNVFIYIWLRTQPPFWCAASTDIERGSQNSYTSPCNGVVSYGAQIGVFRFLPSAHIWKRLEENASTIFAHCAAFHTCLSLLSDCGT